MRLTERVAAARLLGTAPVTGYGLRFHKRSVDGSGKCSIAAPGPGIYVAVYEMSPADKAVLDRIEGIGLGYAEHVIAVPGFDDCVTYVAEANHVDDSLLPYHWYRELVMLGCRHHGFPVEYMAMVAAIDSIPDPEIARLDENEKLIDRIRKSVD